MRDNNVRDSLRVKASVKTEEAGPNPAPLLNNSQQWIDVGGNPIVRHAGVAARVRNKTCYPLGNGLRWTDPEVIARKESQHCIH